MLPDTARRFARAIVIPNLKPPVTATEIARAKASGTVGDFIIIDADARLLQLNVPDVKFARRCKAWQAPPPRYKRSALAK